MCFQVPRRSASHGSLARTLCISLRFYRSVDHNRQQTNLVPRSHSVRRGKSEISLPPDRGRSGYEISNRQQTTTDPVHSHGEINPSRHRHRLKKGLRWLTFSTDVSKLLIIGCFVCSHDRHHFLTLCQIYSITDKVQHSLQTRNLNLTATNEIRFADR